MRKKWVVTSFAGALIGICVSAVSVYEYFLIRRHGLEESSFCAISEVVNCDIINASSYAVLFGVPVAVWGILFYLTIAGFLFVILLSRTVRKRALAFIFVLSIVGFLWTLRMAYVSIHILNAICVSCAIQYAVNIFLLIGLMLASTSFLKDRFRLMFSRKIFSYLLTTAIIFGIGYAFALSSVRGTGPEITPADIKTLVNAHFRQSLYDITPGALSSAPVWGNKDAKTTIVEFSDFQCPFCRLAAFNIKPYLHEFRDKIKMVFIHYPLDNACNPYMQGPMHRQACLASQAAVCAQEKGKFWQYHGDLFKNQNKISREVLVRLAEKDGIDKAWFEGCIDSPETLAKVKSDIELAHHIYLTGTPSLFINQRKLAHWRAPEIMRAIVKEEIKRAVRKSSP